MKMYFSLTSLLLHVTYTVTYISVNDHYLVLEVTSIFHRGPLALVISGTFQLWQHDPRPEITDTTHYLAYEYGPRASFLDLGGENPILNITILIEDLESEAPVGDLTGQNPRLHQYLWDFEDVCSLLYGSCALSYP
jgi:hypothetical protein